MEQITREVFWNIPGPIQALAYTAIALSLAWSAWMLYRRLRQSQGGVTVAGVAQGVKSVLIDAIVQKKIWREPRAGVMHLCIFSGFVVLFIGTAILSLDHSTPLDFFHGWFYLAYSFTLDVFGLVFIAGLLMAVHRRYVRKLGRLENRGENAFMLLVLLAIGIGGFLLEGARIAITLPDFEVWSFVGYSLARLFRLFGLESAPWFHRTLWVTHVALVVMFFAALVTTRLRHLVLAPVNIFVRGDERPGMLNAVAAQLQESAASGAGSFSWQRLLAANACIACGRCDAVCPAHASGKPLSPRGVIRKVQESTLGGSAAGTAGFIVGIAPDEAWSCTTCGACSHACPVSIPVVETIVDVRRQMTEQGTLQATAAKALEGMAERGNAWAQPASQRTEWAGNTKLRTIGPDDDVEYLYWVGCAGAYDPNGQEVTRAMVSLLEKAGVSYGMLGSGERCTGDAARRMGEEGLFRRLAQENIEVLGKHRFKKILTHCAHCYNVFKNEYPALGGEYAVVHHAQLLPDLVAQGKLAPSKELGKRVTFHDPCYLGRYNGEYDAPRKVLGALPAAELTEMERSREKSSCCGGGGGGMWIDIRAGKRIDSLRTADVEASGAEVVATACPFCKSMLAAGMTSKGLGEKIKVKDIAELLNESQ